MDAPPNSKLSQHDREILERIFDDCKMSAYSGHAPTPSIAVGEFMDLIPSGPINTETTAQVCKPATKLEIDAVKLAEEGRYEEAVEKLGRSISVDPLAASAYNNRAQVYRLMHQNELALNDLNKAIELGDNDTALKQAYTQRGMLYFAARREEEAHADFGRGAELGSSLSRKMLVRCNPYTALCNNMLREVFEKLYSTPDHS